MSSLFQVPMDGNCMMHAILVQLGISDPSYTHIHLRRQLINFLVEYQHHLLQGELLADLEDEIMEEGMATGVEYLKHLLQPGAF